MNKFLFFILLALVATPVYAEESNDYLYEYFAKQRAQDKIEHEKNMELARQQAAEQDARVQASVERYLKSSEEYSKFLAKCKTCAPRPIRIEPMIRIRTDNIYVPMCAYGSC